MKNALNNTIALNEQIAVYFYDEKQLSSLSVYMYILRVLRSDLHKSDMEDICNYLNINMRSLMNRISHLRKIGAINKYNSEYWGLVSWRKWMPDSYTKYYNGEKKNRIIEIEKGVLKSSKKLRNYIYLSFFKRAYFMAKENSAVDNIPNSRRRVKQDSAQSVGLAFVKAVSGRSESLQTILNYRNTLVQEGFIEVESNVERLAVVKTYNDAIQMKKVFAGIPIKITREGNDRFSIFQVNASRMRLIY